MTYTSALFPIPGRYRAARFLANTNLPRDPADGVYRREPLFNTFDGRVDAVRGSCRVAGRPIARPGLSPWRRAR